VLLLLYLLLVLFCYYTKKGETIFKNIYYDTKKSILHEWSQEKGEDKYTKKKWTPYLFMLWDAGHTKSIDGYNCYQMEFESYYAYYAYSKENQTALENNVRPEIQYLSEAYHNIPDDDIEPPLLKVYSIDIEVDKPEDGSFPVPELAEGVVTLISIVDQHAKTTVVFGLEAYNGKWKDSDWLTYVHCKDEAKLLVNFFNYMYKNPCDVLTGWYVQSFDLIYLVNRAKNLFGKNDTTYTKLSPIGWVRTWKQADKHYTNIDIAGVTILDYIDLYKWYSTKKLEQYKLDFVCMHELGEGKIDYSDYENLDRLRQENWDLYTEYNIIDAYRVIQLEEKNGFIKLVQSLSLLCRTPMKFYNAMTMLIEGLLITHYRRNDLCAPRFYGGVQETFPAAIVKEPQKGMHDWVVDLDITSSYPTAIITLNMSLETYYGRILGMTESEVMSYTTKREFAPFDFMMDRGKVRITGAKLNTFNRALKKRLLAIAPCGSVFTTNKPGVIACIEKQVFNKRVDVRRSRTKLLASLPDLRDSSHEMAKNKAAQYYNTQWALKIILNAVYGILAVPYSRYFNVNIAEAVTSCARVTIMDGEKFVNDLLNTPTCDIVAVLDKMRKESEL